MTDSNSAQAAGSAPVLEVKDLVVTFGAGSSAVTVLKGVNASISRGQTLGIVGESGSGKSTLAKAIVGLVHASSGSILVDGIDVGRMTGPQRRDMRRKVQMIPQDPYSSLNPRRTIGQTLAEAIDPVRSSPMLHREKIEYWLSTIRLDADVASRYPHEFSGGQRQRIAVARALAVEPRLIIADEITSALDLSVQAELLNLVGRLRRELDLTMAFISHDLDVVHHVSDSIMVLYNGDVVEAGSVDAVYQNPQDPYTRKLIDSVPGGPGFDIG
ncbi:ABC transporter ATP-binding protein [Arthrobacter sp. 35W]|uniref:ABC transporter ATP-binding protein n=1 Tax=Arthrobacter sp. 35W TaxID=1132441 RepID=UPI000429EC7A|nr:ATP-binding cassette domain-containing protein [Arthrobacter sp. 35W]